MLTPEQASEEQAAIRQHVVSATCQCPVSEQTIILGENDLVRQHASLCLKSEHWPLETLLNVSGGVSYTLCPRNISLCSSAWPNGLVKWRCFFSCAVRVGRRHMDVHCSTSAPIPYSSLTNRSMASDTRKTNPYSVSYFYTWGVYKNIATQGCSRLLTYLPKFSVSLLCRLGG